MNGLKVALIYLFSKVIKILPYTIQHRAKIQQKVGR